MADGLLKERVREQARREIERRKQMLEQKDRCEQDLLAFVETFWPVLEPQRPLIGGWLLDFLCDVLMAVTDGQLVHVCINVPPGSGKSSLLNVLWPAWEWGPQNMAHLRYMSISYSTGVPVRDNQRFARIVQHPVYQRLWGDRVRLTKARDDLVENAGTGWKLVASVGGTTTGFRGDRLLLDDLNNPKNVESETVREDTNQFVREVMPSRVNDLAKSAIINLQQRTHRSDVTATLIEHGQDYEFVCVPMEFDPLRICSVVLRRNEDGEAEQTWTDPRALDEHGGLLSGLTVNERGEPDVRFGSPMAQAQGQICWPELFTPEAIAKLKAMSGPYGWDSQFNQFPGVRGGSIIRRDWWKLWNGPYPELGTVIVSLDTATEEGSQNDYNACTVFAAFAGLEGEPQLLLLDAWRERLPLAQLVAKVARTCQERAADYLLIEHKTRGRDVHDEIVRIYVSAKWQTELVKPGTIDKINRLKAVEHLFSGDYRMDPATKIESWSGGIVFAPDRDFADMVITEVADFPYAPHDDLVDCVSMCLGWVRRNGVILRKVEWAEEEVARNTFRKSPGVPYAIKSSQ